jgi:hypothetical protein
MDYLRITVAFPVVVEILLFLIASIPTAGPAQPSLQFADL